MVSRHPNKDELDQGIIYNKHDIGVEDRSRSNPPSNAARIFAFAAYAGMAHILGHKGNSVTNSQLKVFPISNIFFVYSYLYYDITAIAKNGDRSN
jgi:hypothetical protein